MIKALFYREWLKTRMAAIIAAALMVCGTAYSLVNSFQMLRLHGAAQVWNDMATGNTPILPAAITWLPLLAALLVALAQFVPEMTDSRLKLTLHLPLQPGTALAVLLGYGCTVIVSAYVLSCALLAAGLSAGFPREITAMALAGILPHMLGGLCAYFLAAWICLEKRWRQRTAYTAIAATLCVPFYAIPAPEAAVTVSLAVLAAVCSLFPYYSMAQFREGAQ